MTQTKDKQPGTKIFPHNCQNKTPLLPKKQKIMLVKSQRKGNVCLCLLMSGGRLHNLGHCSKHRGFRNLGPGAPHHQPSSYWVSMQGQCQQPQGKHQCIEQCCSGQLRCSTLQACMNEWVDAEHVLGTCSCVLDIRRRNCHFY